MERKKKEIKKGERSGRKYSLREETRKNPRLLSGEERIRDDGYQGVLKKRNGKNERTHWGERVSIRKR